VQYELTLVLDLSLRRESDGRVLWYVTGMRESDEYSASSQVVVTSSSQFQQQTLDATNLPCQSGTCVGGTAPGSTCTTSGDCAGGGTCSTRPCNPQFSNVQMAETLRQDAITRLLRQAARDLYNQMVEGF
jgi:hypothetical protein